MQHLFSVWPEKSRRLKAAGHVLLLCDYDGTLTPIVDSPELADLPEVTRHYLQYLSLQARLSFHTKIPDHEVEGWSSPCIFGF